MVAEEIRDHQDLKTVLILAPEGPRVEIGVFKGKSLAIIARHKGLTVGFDSFEGMPEPTGADDYDGQQYPKGRMAYPLEGVRRLVGSNVDLIKGWAPKDLPLLNWLEWAFVKVDLDHYESTLATLHFMWKRMLPGGILCSHDYVPQNGEKLAMGAIKRFSSEIGVEETPVGKHCWWRK